MFSLTKFLKRHLRQWERYMHKNRSLFIYGVFIYLTWDMRTWSLSSWEFEIQWKVLIFPLLNATETIKNWSKRKVSGLSKFSISSIGQNRKPGNLGNWHFFFSSHIVKLKFFILGHFYDFEFYILPKIWVKQNFPRFPSFRFWVYRGKSKTRKPRKLVSFFLLNHILTS